MLETRVVSPATCNRVREALSVGQVWGDAALLEHAKTCEVCTNELAVLKKRRDFRDAFPVLSSIADESERSPTRPPVDENEARQRAARRRHLFVMIAALVAILGFVTRGSIFGVPSTAPEGDGTLVTGPPKFRIANIENALFQSKVEGGTVRSSMTRGVAAFHVEQLSPNQRFLVALPDADIEVRGTLFVVSVEGGKTRGVEVNEGSVELRLHGREAVLLSDGEHWPADGTGRPTVSFMSMAPGKDAAAPEPSKPKD